MRPRFLGRVRTSVAVLLSRTHLSNSRPVTQSPGSREADHRPTTVQAATFVLSILGIACGDGPAGSNVTFILDSTLALQPVVGSLNFPLYLTAPPADMTRLFIVEKAGVIRIVKNGVLLSTPFLDLTEKTSKGGEQGLLGLAFDPDYANNGRFFASYTSPQGSLPGGTSVISRFQVSTDPDVADAGSEVVILTLDQPFDNHNGGMITFGPDGYLYVGFGDGGSGGDPLGNGQDRRDLLGSLLRLDVSGNGTYAIPPDNPYAGSLTLANELWNYGLRNPWRFSFDRQTGDLYIGDVGQGSREEIDLTPASSPGGENYGWNIMEGFGCFQPVSNCDPTGLTLPVADYTHADGCAVIGGYVYRGMAAPPANGIYLYGDLCSGWVRSFRAQGGQVSDHREWPLLERGSITSFGEDAQGELYVLDPTTVYRVVPN